MHVFPKGQVSTDSCGSLYEVLPVGMLTFSDPYYFGTQIGFFGGFPCSSCDGTGCHSICVHILLILKA